MEIKRFVAQDGTYLDLDLGTGLAYYDYQSRHKLSKLVEVNFTPLPLTSTLDNPIIKARTKINNRQWWGYIIVHTKSIRFKTGKAPQTKILLPAFSKGDLNYD